jgi:hypothetical protein
MLDKFVLGDEEGRECKVLAVSIAFFSFLLSAESLSPRMSSLANCSAIYCPYSCSTCSTFPLSTMAREMEAAEAAITIRDASRAVGEAMDEGSIFYPLSIFCRRREIGLVLALYFKKMRLNRTEGL